MSTISAAQLRAIKAEVCASRHAPVSFRRSTHREGGRFHLILSCVGVRFNGRAACAPRAKDTACKE